MTPEQHAQHIRQLEFQLHKADYGMGMPRDYSQVLWLRDQLEQARKDMIAAVWLRIAEIIVDDSKAQP